MGELLNRFKEVAEQKKKYKIPQEPNKAKEPEEWLKWKNIFNKGDIYTPQLRGAIMTFDLPREQWEAIYKDALGEKDYKKYIDEDLWKQSFFPDEVSSYIHVHQEILNDLSEEDRKVYSDNLGNDRLRIYQKLVKDGKIPKEEMDRIYKDTFSRNAVLAEPDMQVKLIEAAEKHLTKEQQEKALAKLTPKKDPLERTAEENIQHPFRKTINQMKETIPEEVKKNPEKEKDYLHVLDFAAEHIIVPEKDYYQALNQEKSDIESLDNDVRNNIFNENKDKFQDGKFNDLYKNVNIAGTSVKIVKEEKNNDFESFKNHPLDLSEKTKTGIELILKKMDEMHLNQYTGVEKGEQGSKVYGFCKLEAKQKALENALNAEKKNPDEIIKAGKEFEETWKEMEELYTIAKQHFSQNKIVFQPNLDSVRTQSIPVTFTSDLATTAQINGLYLTYMTLKQNNISVEEYLKNPAAAVLNNGMKYFKENGIGAFSKNFSFKECCDLLFKVGDYHNTGNQFERNSPRAGINRTLYSSNYLESDPEKQKNNTVYLELLVQHVNGVHDRETAKYVCINSKVNTEEERISRDRTLQNLLVVADKDRNMDTVFADLPLTDVNGKVTRPAFDLDQYIRTHDIDYERVINNTARMQKEAERSNTGYILKDDINEAAMNAYYRILVAKQADRGKRGFNQLEEKFLNSLSNMTENPRPEDAIRLDDMKERLSAQVDEYKYLYRPEMKCSEILTNIAEADRSVYNGSNQYDEAWTAAKELNEMFKKYQTSFGSDFSDTGKIAHLEAMRQKMVEAKTKATTYINYKLPNGRTVNSLDPKPRRRVRTMQQALGVYDRLIQWADRTKTELETGINTRRTQYQNAQNNAQNNEEVYKSDFGIYEDPNHFGGKTRSEQLSFMYEKLKEVDPALLHSHTEFREFRSAFEKFKEFGDNHRGTLNRREMDEYLTLANDVKAKAKIYQNKKAADAAEHLQRTGRPLEVKPSTQSRIDLCGRMIDMVDQHLIFSSGKKYLKEVGGNPYERALAKWAVLVRQQDIYRDNNIYKKIAFTNSVARGMYLERIRTKLREDPQYTVNQFEEDMKPENIRNGAREILTMFDKVSYKNHIDDVREQKSSTEYKDPLENDIVDPKRYKYAYYADENMDYSTSSEADLPDLRGTDHAYVRGELKNFLSKLLIYRNGQFKNESADFIRSFGYEISEDGKHLKYNPKFKGDPEVALENIYVKTETMDYTKLSDAELSEKMDELKNKEREYRRLSNLEPENASEEELNSVRENVRERIQFGPERRAEISLSKNSSMIDDKNTWETLGFSRETTNLEKAVEEEFKRRAEIYADMETEVGREIKKAQEVLDARKKVSDFNDARRRTAENLKPGDILHVEIDNRDIKTLEVLGVKDGTIYFDDFGFLSRSSEPSYLTPEEGDAVYNKGGISIDKFVKNTNINLKKETTRRNASNEYKKMPISGDIGRKEFLNKEYKDRMESLTFALQLEYQDYKAGKTPQNPEMRQIIEETVKLYKEEIEKKRNAQFDDKKRLRLQDLLSKKRYNSIKDPNQKQKIYEEAEKEAIEVAKREISQSIDDDIIEKGHDKLKVIARKMVNEKYDPLVEQMNNYPARMKKAMNLYSYIDLTNPKKPQNEKKENRIIQEEQKDLKNPEKKPDKEELKNLWKQQKQDDVKELKEILKDEIEEAKKGKGSFKEDNNIIIEDDRDFEQNRIIVHDDDTIVNIIFEKADDQRETLEKEAGKLLKEKKALLKENKPENKNRIDEINKDVRKIAHNVLFLDFAEQKYREKSIGLKQFYTYVAVEPNPDAKKDWTNALDSVKGFEEKFDAKMDGLKHATHTLDYIRGFRDEALAEITLPMEKKEAKSAILRIGGDLGEVGEIQGEMMKNQKNEMQKGKPGAKPNNMEGAKEKSKNMIKSGM